MKFFRRTLKTGKKITKKLIEKPWKPWNWGKIFGRHPCTFITMFNSIQLLSLDGEFKNSEKVGTIL